MKLSSSSNCPLSSSVRERKSLITTSTPSNWRELQDQTCEILRQCGFTAETEAKIQTVRGEVEIDVLCHEAISGRRLKSIFECKRWKSRVTQTVVHALKSVVDNSGANAGYIISLKGFQSGAYEACKNTNIKLFTWAEFQGEFASQWAKSHFHTLVKNDLRILFKYFNLVSNMMNNRELLVEDEDVILTSIWSRYHGIHRLISDLSNDLYCPILFPLECDNGRYENSFENVRKAKSYLDLLSAIIELRDPVIEEIKQLSNMLWDRGDIFDTPTGVMANAIRRFPYRNINKLSAGNRNSNNEIVNSPSSDFLRTSESEIYEIISKFDLHLFHRTLNKGNPKNEISMELVKAIFPALSQKRNLKMGEFYMASLAEYISLSKIEAFINGSERPRLPEKTIAPIRAYLNLLPLYSKIGNNDQATEFHNSVVEHLLGIIKNSSFQDF